MFDTKCFLVSLANSKGPSPLTLSQLRQFKQKSEYMMRACFMNNLTENLLSKDTVSASEEVGG